MKITTARNVLSGARKGRIARNLVEENRVKRRKTSSGAPRALDSEDE